jgi:2-keto-4-pentenoate hydratase/2-oxohepta-3-ene-1,7-dioic acid hydratase in catechol pathway
MGPALVTKKDIPDPHTMRIQTLLYGETMQDGNTSDMIFDVPTVIEFLSGSTTLLPAPSFLPAPPMAWDTGGSRKCG